MIKQCRFWVLKSQVAALIGLRWGPESLFVKSFPVIQYKFGHSHLICEMGTMTMVSISYLPVLGTQ